MRSLIDLTEAARGLKIRYVTMPPCRKGKATTTSSSRHHNRTKGSPQALGHLLQRGLKAPGLKRLGNLLQLGNDWPWIVGPRFSKQIFPGTLAHGVLWVACSHPAWGSEAQHYSRIFLKTFANVTQNGQKFPLFGFFTHHTCLKAERIAILARNRPKFSATPQILRVGSNPLRSRQCPKAFAGPLIG